MVAGLKFLSKKSFNPQNLSNQERVYVRQQESKLEEERLKRRERQLTIERDAEELARARDGDSGGQKATLRFMYDAPPGLADEKRNNNIAQNNNEVSEKKSGEAISYDKMAGDDDAAAAFRRILAGEVGNPGDDDDDENYQMEMNRGVDVTDKASSLILSGSNAEVNSTEVKSELSQLEKAVGKRNTSSALTYEEQIARFPQLKNAPVAIKRKGQGGETGATSNFNFKPLGAQIRNVRCMVCKVWGHSKGDRECSMSGWDPFSVPSTAKVNTIGKLPTGSDSGNNDQSNEINHKKNASDDSDEYERRKRRKKEKRKKESKRNRKERKHEKKDRKRKRERYEDSDDSRRRRKRSDSKSRKDDKRKLYERKRSRSKSYDSEYSYSSRSR